MKDEQYADITVNEKLQPIELEQYDASQHAGKRVKLERVETKMTDRFKDKEGRTKKSFYLRVESEPLDTFTKNDGKEVVVRASRIFGLQQDAQGVVGWAENSKLSAFLRSLKVEHPEALVGKEVVVLLTDADNNGNRYCTF